MMRLAIRGLVFLGALALVADSTARGQTADKVSIRDRKDGKIKPYEGLLKVSPAGFQVVGGEKFDVVKITTPPDDIVSVAIGDLPNVQRDDIWPLAQKEEKRDFDGARLGYAALVKKYASAPERTKRYLEFKVAMNNNKLVDELDVEKGWKAKAEEAAKVWAVFLAEYKSGWELWPAVRAATRLQIELGKFEDAARAWGRLAKNPEMPPDAKLEAAIQELDLQIRSNSPLAAPNAAELVKTAAGAKKDRLVIYEIAAKARSNSPLEGIDKIKEEMAKTKDASVQATAYSMLGELYLAGGKTRDAMWAFLWVETVLNQDKDEALKAIVRLAEMSEMQNGAEDDQTKKYRDKLKRFRANF